MLLTVVEFRERVASDIDNLVSELKDRTGRRNPQEEAAWRSSFPKVCAAFSSPFFNPLHLYFGQQGNLTLEYRLPAASSWCDLVLLGAFQGTPSVVIVELKDWLTRNDKPGPAEGIMLRHTGPSHHPSDQVRGYVNYCRRFHSVVLDCKALVHGCVLFTGDSFFDAYRDTPNDKLFRDFPAYSIAGGHADAGIAHFFSERLNEPNPEFAASFEKGVYKQDRNFVRQMAEQIRDASAGPFELLDNQRLGLAVCLSAVENAVFTPNHGPPQKTAIIVHGPPGSGKSVVAGKLWATLATDSRLENGENFVVVTTSKAQESNWRKMFEVAAQNGGAGGVVVAANKFAPENIPALGKWMKKFPGKFKDPLDWKENCRLISTLRGGPLMPDNQMLVSIVDEAHALMNPELPDARTQSGWPVALGPQAYHIMRSSVVSIFFLDAKQGFRERENTTIDNIHQWARELGAKIIPTISLEEAQFRCGGSREFVEWVDGIWEDFSKAPKKVEKPALLMAAEKPRSLGIAKAQTTKMKGIETCIFDSLPEMEAALRAKVGRGHSARLLASFSRKWITKNVGGDVHSLPGDMLDFQFQIEGATSLQRWSRPWNVVPGGVDYAAFIQGPPGVKIYNDPLAEVGCPYAVRGFDFDYVGLLWLDDLAWVNGSWEVHPKNVHETGLKRSVGRALKEKESDGPHHRHLLKKVSESYRILMTRALKGLFIWFENESTKGFFLEQLQGWKKEP